MNITSAIGLSPLGAYHSLMYGKSMYFDIQEEKKFLISTRFIQTIKCLRSHMIGTVIEDMI